MLERQINALVTREKELLSKIAAIEVEAKKHSHELTLIKRAKKSLENLEGKLKEGK
jgi:hypothetical protein